MDIPAHGGGEVLAPSSLHGQAHEDTAQENQEEPIPAKGPTDGQDSWQAAPQGHGQGPGEHGLDGDDRSSRGLDDQDPRQVSRHDQPRLGPAIKLPEHKEQQYAKQDRRKEAAVYVGTGDKGKESGGHEERSYSKGGRVLRIPSGRGRLVWIQLTRFSKEIRCRGQDRLGVRIGVVSRLEQQGAPDSIRAGNQGRQKGVIRPVSW